jgi:hypothetical protein
MAASLPTAALGLGVRCGSGWGAPEGSTRGCAVAGSGEESLRNTSPMGSLLTGL